MKHYEPIPAVDPNEESATPVNRVSLESLDTLSTLPGHVLEEKTQKSLKPAFIYVIVWITLSSSVVLFNKWILHGSGFSFPLFLTTWHLLFATIVTQILSRTTRLLDSRRRVPMTYKAYLKAIIPIAILNSLSLICGNVVFLYLSVSFVEMLKASNAVATLLASWFLGLAKPSLKTLGIISVIVGGVAISSFGELHFNLFGFLIQIAGVICEAFRLAMVQRLLSSDEFKMDPLASLYYVAPASTIMIGITAFILDFPRMTLADFQHIGFITLLTNAIVAFLLNVSVVLLIDRTSAVVMTLCGVLKNILIVVASMIFFRDPVTLTQAVGYSVALGGLVYYKLGSDTLICLCGDVKEFWQELGEQRATSVKFAIIALVTYLLATLVVGGYFFLPLSVVRT